MLGIVDDALDLAKDRGVRGLYTEQEQQREQPCELAHKETDLRATGVTELALAVGTRIFESEKPGKLLEGDCGRAAFLAAASEGHAIASLGLRRSRGMGVERCAYALRLSGCKVIGPGSGCGFWPVRAFRRDGRDCAAARFVRHSARTMMAAVAAAALREAVSGANGEERRGQREAEE